jgi:hypothetical protein
MQTRPIPLFAFIAVGTLGHTNGGPPRIEMKSSKLAAFAIWIFASSYRSRRST